MAGATRSGTVEVVFEHGPTRLAGALALPPTPGPHPGVVFVHGSGPAHRDQGVIPPLRDRFTARGIAVLAYDKPGVGGSTGAWTSQSFDDRAGEALAAARFLRSEPEIDPRAVGLLGGSQGGWVAPLAATMGEVAFVIAVSGPGMTPAEQELYRVEHELRAEGFAGDQVERALEVTRACQAALRAGRPAGEILDEAKEVQAQPWFGHLLLHEATPEMLEFVGRIQDFDPAPVLERVGCPLLGIWGARDLLVSAHHSLATFAAALAKGGNPNVRLEVFPEADHGLRRAVTGAGNQPASEFVPGFFPSMTGWIRESALAGLS
jgi:pimeloyl-ACP methyl ester carboxylesterase